jgi:hypothetical protein
MRRLFKRGRMDGGRGGGKGLDEMGMSESGSLWVILGSVIWNVLHCSALYCTYNRAFSLAPFPTIKRLQSCTSSHPSSP